MEQRLAPPELRLMGMRAVSASQAWIALEDLLEDERGWSSWKSRPDFQRFG